MGNLKHQPLAKTLCKRICGLIVFKFFLVKFVCNFIYNPDPQRNLVDEIRKVVLLNQPADSFIWTLLKLLYEADCCMGKKTPVLSRYFADEEFLGAKETIKTLVTVSMQDAASTDAASAQSFELEIIG